MNNFTITPATITGVTGQLVNVPVNVKDFLNVGAITLKLSYNTAVLDWVGTENWDSQCPDALANAVNGVVIIAWDGLNGVNIFDGKLVDLIFRYKEGSSLVSFIISECEIANVQAKIIEMNYNDGAIQANT